MLKFIQGRNKIVIKKQEEGIAVKGEVNFLRLLDSVIHNKVDSDILPVDYKEVLSIAQSHNMYALICEKLKEYPNFTETPIYEVAITKQLRIIAEQIQRTYAFLEVYQAFSTKNIYPIVMKGIICRRLYGELCNHRPSADEDILVRRSDFQKIWDILQAQGYIPERQNLTQNQISELQEISFFHPKYKLTIEVHTNPIGKENDIRCQMNDFFVKVFDNMKVVQIEGIEIWTMSDTDHFLFLILHAFKHMMSSGFGFRQVLDILLFYEQNENAIDMPYILDKLSEVKAKHFFSDLIHIGNQYLGFHFTAPEEEHCVEELLEDLMENGIFGNTTQAQIMARSMTNAALEKGNRKETPNLMRAIFPNKSYLISGYPELVEHPWLLPVCWAKRWIRFLRDKTRYRGNLVGDSIEISSRKINFLKKYDIM